MTATTTTPKTATVKAWLAAGHPLSYARERGMCQLSQYTPSNDKAQCEALYDHAKEWAAENPERHPPVLIHYDETTVALFCTWGARKGQPLFNPKKAAAAKGLRTQSCQEAESRKAFERWRKQGGYQDKLDRFGRYETPEGRAAWMAWQASRLHQMALPGVSDEVLVSEYQSGYQTARSGGKDIHAAEEAGVRAVRGALLPVWIRLQAGVSADELADVVSRAVHSLPTKDLPEFKRKELQSVCAAALRHLGISNGLTSSKDRLEVIMAGIRSAFERELAGRIAA